MMDIEELKGYMKSGSVKLQNIWQIERDYIQHIMLAALYSSKFASMPKGIIFKGGTMLQKLGIADRFSIDLDFTSGLDKINLEQLFEDAKKYFDDIAITCTYSVEKKTNSITARFIVEGPQYIQLKSENAKVSVKLEISFREAVILDADIVRIIPIYRDIMPYMISSMKIEEAAAEKARAVITRNKSRDVYDLWLLLKKGYNLHEFLVNKKLEFYSIVFSPEMFKTKIDEKRKMWNTELKNLLYAIVQKDTVNIPDFDIVKKDIMKYIENNTSLTAEFELAGSRRVMNQGGFTIPCSRISALSKKELKIKNGVLYLNYDADIDAFAYFEYRKMHLIITIEGAYKRSSIDLKTIKYPDTTNGRNIRILINKGELMHTELFVEDTNLAEADEKIFIGIIVRKHF
jgi:predicted nucleotidyltransferase component of viral defense system